MTRRIKTLAEKSSVTVVVAEGRFEFKGTRPDGSAKWHFVANAETKRKKPPRRFMGLMYQKGKGQTEAAA